MGRGIAVRPLKPRTPDAQQPGLNVEPCQRFFKLNVHLDISTDGYHAG